MNPDLQTFLQAWTGGAEVSDAERQRLIRRLETDDAFRAECVEEIRLLGMIRAVQTPSPRWLGLHDALGLSAAAPDETSSDDLASRVLHLVQKEPRLRAKASWLSWRPLTAAAAGIAFGMLCTSVVFGYVMPRAVATASQLLALVDGSFEKHDGGLASGFPAEFGVWSGEETEIVQTGPVEALDEKRMLRFVRSGELPTLKGSCDIYQLVDLRSLGLHEQDGESTLELSARFLDGRTVVGEPWRFIIRLYVFSGSPDDIRSDWPRTRHEALSAGSARHDSSGGKPHSWREVTTKALLSANADFALVHLAVFNPAEPRGAVTDFGQQFLDDVRLTLKTQPVLPVRLSQR